MARAAETGSPVRIISIATFFGICGGSRNVPPAPARMPRLTSGSPKDAVSAATTRSEASEISVPPPRAKPLTAAMVGLEMGWADVAGEPPGRPPRVGRRQ